MNIYFQELKFYRRSTIIWMLIFALGVFGYMSMFVAFSNDIAASKKILDMVPVALRTALGIKTETFFTVFGFFGYLLTYFWLVGAIQAMNLGIGVTAKEISGKTADFLLSKPVSRFRVLVSKLGAVFTLIVLTNLVFIASAYLSALTFSKDSFDTKTFVLIALSMFFVQTFFLGLGFLIANLKAKIKSPVSYSLPIVFGFFIAGLLDSLVGSDTIRYLKPFKHFDVSYIVTNGSYDWKYMFVELGAAVFCIIMAFLIYQRKDIQAVA